MRQGFSSNAYEDGTHPIARDAKEGDLVELVFAQRDGYVMHIGYSRGFYNGHLHITPSDPPGPTNAFILSGIREYRIHRNDSN
ncbi:hypothetical protein HY448_01435 [Candidatus Pacearchaeota archaeon]|nr:hypothetical protein [Candidatus Pacearchaeota archaeon]